MDALMEQIDKGTRLPTPPIILDGVNFGLPAPLYASQEEAYAAMLAEFSDCIQDLEMEGVKVSMKDYIGQANQLWQNVWRHFASSSRT
jgi:hypothetical protein